MVRKILIYKIVFFCLFFFSSNVFALNIDDVLNNDSHISSAIVGISVKDADTGNIIYQKNPKTLLHPASTLKIITSAAALDYLGAEYTFKTIFYKNGQDVYLKVGADPLFSYSDLYNLVAAYKAKNSKTFRNIYIDDKIVDKIPFGIGWQWDDNANINFPQMSPYIVNNNLFMIKANLSDKQNVSIEHAIEYSEPVINNLKYGEKQKIEQSRDVFRADGAIILNGTINKTTIIDIPAKNPQQMYSNVLGFAFLQNKIPFTGKYRYAVVPRFSAQEAIITHSIEDVLKIINQNSNNLAAEILLKHAAFAKTETPGTTQEGLNIVKNFYTDKGVDLKNIILVDASGVSMNDYVTADFMTSALIAIKNTANFDMIKNSMSDFSQGTFKGRIPELKNNIKAKTGTLANTSSVVGYMRTKTGKNIVFAIILDNLPKGAKAKDFENRLLKAFFQI